MRAFDWIVHMLDISKLLGNFLFQRQILILTVLLSFVVVSCEMPVKEEFIDAAPASDVLAIVPYSLDEEGRMLIDVEVNDVGPYKFIVDSAASRTLLFENLRKQLGLEFQADETTFVHGAIINEHRPVLSVGKLKVGSLLMENFRSFSIPDPDALTGDMQQGILGLDFLSQYAMYVNVDDSRIIFAKSGYRPSSRKYTTVPIEFDDLGLIENGLPIIQVRVQDRSMDALLDLGASQTIANWAAANLFGINIRRFLRDRSDFQGIFSAVPVRARATGAAISIGKRVWTKQTIDIANLKIFETLGRGEQPAIIISAALLREEDYIIDFPASRFHIRVKPENIGRGITERCTLDLEGFITCSRLDSDE